MEITGQSRQWSRSSLVRPTCGTSVKTIQDASDAYSKLCAQLARWALQMRALGLVVLVLCVQWQRWWAATWQRLTHLDGARGLLV